jgi:hypothetical protein
MTSLLTKSALDNLPADIRDHIIVESETGYSITLSMTIGDFERLVAPHSIIGLLRAELEEAERELYAAERAADDAEAERDDANKAIDEALRRLNELRQKAEDNGIQFTIEDLDSVIEVLDQ